MSAISQRRETVKVGEWKQCVLGKRLPFHPRKELIRIHNLIRFQYRKHVPAFVINSIQTYSMYSIFSGPDIFRKRSQKGKSLVTFTVELSLWMKTFLSSPAYDKDVSNSVCSHGCVQLSSHSSFSSDVAKVSKQRKITLQDTKQFGFINWVNNIM